MDESYADYLKASGYNEADIREEEAYESSLYIKYLDLLIEHYKKWDAMKFVITNKEYAYAEYGSQFGLKISMYNGYKKTIKYVSFTVRPYNRVGDVTYDDLGRNKKIVQVIGPIAYGKEVSVTFNNMFWDDRDIIDCLSITHIKLEFMDGSVIPISNVSKHLDSTVSNKCR